MIQFLDGFDKYGSVNSNTSSVASLMAGEWTTTGSTGNIVAGLSATGYALSFGSATTFSKTLASNQATLILGYRFNTALSQNLIITFTDAGTAQATVMVNVTSGTISVRTGGSAGALIATSTSAVAANTTHYLEMSLSFTATGAYQVWLDGISILSGTGNLHTTSNTTANGFLVNAGNATIDDLYVFDTTGATNNAPVLTSPRIETTFPVSDASIQFAIGASIFGNSVSRAGGTMNASANFMYLRPITATQSCTLNTLYMLPYNSVTGNWQLVIYADSAGVPGALLGYATASGSGFTAGVPIFAALLTPVNLTAGTQYWIGFISGTTGMQVAAQDSLALTRQAAVTFTGTPPSTCPATSAGVATLTTWGAVTGILNNTYEVSQQPPPGQYSYVYDSTVGHQDLFNFSALSVIPTTIYAVAVKAYAAKSDSGNRTMSLRTLSSGANSGGNLTGQGLGVTYQWMGSMFETDPATSVAWTGVGLNAAQSGYRIDS